MTLLPVVKAFWLASAWLLPAVGPYDPPLPEWWNGGRFVTIEAEPDDPDQSDLLHLGARPALDFGNGVGLTLQLTVRTPW